MAPQTTMRAGPLEAIERLAELVNGDCSLVRRGRYVTDVFMIEIGSASYYLRIDKGRYVGSRADRFVSETLKEPQPPIAPSPESNVLIIVVLLPRAALWP